MWRAHESILTQAELASLNCSPLFPPGLKYKLQHCIIVYSTEPESNPALKLVKLKEAQSMKEHEVAMGFSAQISAAAFHTALGPIFDDGLILVQHCTLSPGLVEQQGQYT